MKKYLVSILFALVVFFGFNSSADATFVSFYDKDGGDLVGFMPNAYDTVQITVANPTLDGYDFAGWATNDEFITIDGNSLTLPWGAFDFRNMVPRSVYATWNPTVYNINYILDGGEAENPQTYTIEDEDITITNPTKNGYTFLNWSDEEGNDLGSEVVILSGSMGDITLVANWEVVNYNITYNLNGGTVSTENPSTYTVNDNITLVNPVRDGYTFKGWIGTDLEKETTEVTINEGSTGDRNYEAVWEKIETTTTTTTSNPQTGDSINTYVVLLSIGSLGIIGTTLYIKKRLFN